MTFHKMNQVKSRKKMRLEKRRRKKLNRAQSFQGQVQNGNENQHVGTNDVNKSLQERIQWKNLPSMNGKPPPIVSGSQRRVRQNVEFVFPRGKNGEVLPYKFESHAAETSKEADEQPHNLKDDKEPSGESTDANESIEDILYRKKKRQDETPTAAASECIIHNREKERASPSDVNERSVETNAQSRELSAGRKRPREKQTHVETDNYGGRLSGLSVEDAVRDKFGCRPRSNSTDGELKLPRRGLCDEHMVLESHKWKLNGKTPKGFVNLGNTCFLNATLQCLAYLPTFCQCLTALPCPTNTKGKESKGQRIMALLRSLLRQVHNVDGNAGSSHAIAPRAIVNAVPSIGGKSYKFRPGRQEDAHEFLVHLLDIMKDGELKAAGVNQQVNGWRERLPIPRLDETTLIHRIFGGYLRSQVRCTACGHRSNTYDPFLDLALEVSKKSANSIASSFSEFTRKETLDSANRWKCSGCKKHVCATKQLTVFRPPLSLCIQLKRFSFGGGFGGYSWDVGHYGGHFMGRGGSKITKPIEFPSELKLPLSDGRKCEYNLTGIVIHVGGSASSGHYTAYVRKPSVAGGGNQWYHMDDSFVEAVSEKTVLKQRDAYVLFYCRKEVKREFPSPPPRGSMSASEARELGAARARARADSMTNEDGKKRIQIPVSDTTSDATTTISGTQIPSPLQLRSPDSAGTSSATADTTTQASTPDSRDESSFSSSSSSSDSSDSDDSSSESGESSTTENEQTPTQPTEPRELQNEDQEGTTPSTAEAGGDTAASSSSESDSDSGVQTELSEVKPSVEAPLNETEDEKRSTSSTSVGRSSTSSSSDSESDGSDPEATNGSSQSLAMRQENKKDSTASDASSSTSSSSDSDSDSDSSSSSDEEDTTVSSAALNESSTSLTPNVPTKDHRETNAGSASEGQKPKKAKPGQSLSESQQKPRTKVVLDRGESRGRLEVMLGPRFKKNAWKPKTFHSNANDREDQHLLGNIAVGKWDDEEPISNTAKLAHSEYRENAVKHMKKQESTRKRRMHLDRWDALLDEGKKKKLKVKHSDLVDGNVEPRNNPFHRIQSSIQRMSSGRAKGAFNPKDKSNKPRRPVYRHANRRSA